MAPKKNTTVEKEYLDLVLDKITTAHAGTNALIEEKFKSIGERVGRVEQSVDTSQEDQRRLTNKVYWMIGVFAGLEFFLAWITHK
jgi:hypothetical protein